MSDQRARRVTMPERVAYTPLAQRQAEAKLKAEADRRETEARLARIRDILPEIHRLPSAPESEECKRTGGQTTMACDTQSSSSSDELSTSSAQLPTSSATKSGMTSATRPEVSSKLGKAGVAERSNLPRGMRPKPALDQLRSRLTGTTPSLSRWLNGARRERRESRAPVPGRAGAVMECWIQPTYSQQAHDALLAVYDLAFLAALERMDTASIGKQVQGMASVLKGRSGAQEAEGAHAWAYGLEGLPAFAIEEAFAEWLRKETWMPTPSEIRVRAEVKAGQLKSLGRDCYRALTKWEDQK